MVRYTTVIRKFGSMGEKTGWTYIEISAEQAEMLNAGVRTSYRVKGKLDDYRINQIAILPMGNGDFIMPLNAAIRKEIDKKEGAMLKVQLTEDKSEFIFNSDFMECLADEPAASAFFQSLAGSHQRYFSKWIDSAKTEPTRTKRIALAVNALAKKWGYPEMIRASQEKK